MCLCKFTENNYERFLVPPSVWISHCYYCYSIYNNILSYVIVLYVCIYIYTYVYILLILMLFLYIRQGREAEPAAARAGRLAAHGREGSRAACFSILCKMYYAIPHYVIVYYIRV